MKKILFTHSYFLRFDPKQWLTGKPYAPLGTLYAFSVLKKNDYEVSFFDTMFAREPDAIIPRLESIKPDIFVIYDDGFNYLTKMCLQNMREAAFKMIQFAKERGCRVIVSSSDSTDRFEMYLNAGADFVILGEAELTLLELTNAFTENSRIYSRLKDLRLMHDHAIVKTKHRNVIRNLDTLPFPAWDLSIMEPYRQMWLKHAGYFSMNMGTTRGCPFKCNWCAKPIYGNRYNSRSPENVVGELILLKEKFGFDHIWFCDDIFGLKPGWVQEFADLVERNVLNLSLRCRVVLICCYRKTTYRDLARAGCDNIWMGAESGSQKILDAMDKGTTVDQIYEATRLLKKCGIKPSFFIQFGYLAETKEDIEKTITMINELLPYEIGISVSYPLPGTVFFEKVKSQLVNKTNWKDSDELALMFSNTYKPAFYKQLHSYVHKSYRKHLAFEDVKQLFRHPRRLNFFRLKRAMSAFYYLPAAFIEKQKLRYLERPAV